MSTATITIPDFQYTSHFYAEMLEDLTQYMRINCPELTDEDPTEIHMQLLRAFSLSYHLNTTLLDLVANESFLPTAKLRASHVALLALINVQLKQASPAVTTLVAQLSQVFTTARTIVPSSSLFATVESKGAQAVEYEVLANQSITKRTDQIGSAYVYDASLAAYTDVSAEAITPTGTFDIGAILGPLDVGDMLYIGHPDVMFNQLNLNIANGGSGYTGCWEYFDGNYDEAQPDSVANLGSTLRFNLNALLGVANRAGTVVRVRSANTGSYQDLVSTWSGSINQIVTGGSDPFLGQAAPSTTATDYIVGSAWRELGGVTDATNSMQIAGNNSVAYTLPQTLEQAWSQTAVGSGVLAVTGYWLRFRVISVAVPVGPVITQIRLDQGKQYLAFPITQGHTRTDNPLGSSNGAAAQTFTFVQFPVIDDTNIIVTVSESGVDQVYARVDNFLNSLPTDRHFTMAFDDDGAAAITFGDGTNGKIPPTGVNNIRASYRTMDEIDGNVGANTITVNRAGVAFLTNLYNPRAASGYAIREGSTTDDLARLKVAGPASLRTRGRAVAPTDAETVARAFKASDGSTPVVRALAIEESFGPKTIELVMVGPGGNAVDASKLSEIGDYFNGTEVVGGVLLMNQQLTPTNFAQHKINVTVTLTGGSVVAVVTALTALLNPLALKSDGTYQWDFGGTVPLAVLYQKIMDTTPPPINAVISTPGGDTVLATRELPVRGTITINGQVY